MWTSYKGELLTWQFWAWGLLVLALLEADRLRQLVVAGRDLVDDDPPLAVRVESPVNTNPPILSIHAVFFIRDTMKF